MPRGALSLFLLQSALPKYPTPKKGALIILLGGLPRGSGI